MVRLVCAIVGMAEEPFSVRVDEDDLVDELKKAIWAQQGYTFPASKLRLFLARKGRAWLKDDDEAAVQLEQQGGQDHALIQTLIKGEHMKATRTLQNVFTQYKMEEVASGQIHVLVVVPEGASARENLGKRKRMTDIPDPWMRALKDEQVEALPSTCEDLKAHLKRELGVKIPIGERHFQMVSVENTAGECTSTFAKLFEPEPRETFSDRTGTIVAAVIDPIWSRSDCATEATYHFVWDSLIVGLLMRVSNGNYRRNTNASTSTGLSRPDLCFYYDCSNVCVFRGEEKASGDLQVPVKELHDKLIWRYDTAPYIFGYAAVGLRVCIAAIRRDEMKERGAKVEIIETYNLGDLNSRLSFFLALLNLSTLFRPVVDLIQPLDVPEYSTIERCNGVRITFTDNCVVKTYPSSMASGAIIQNLKTLHSLMKMNSVPNVVVLKSANVQKKHVLLMPVGRLSPPENVHQLLTALRDILSALVSLHAIKLMHRDLRWENVLKYSHDSERWFLIDFDEGASSPAARITHLKAESHAPEIMSSASHGVKVDIWSVGFLLKTSPVQDLPTELAVIMGKCLQRSPTKRPTSKSLLKAVEALLKGFEGS